MAISKSDEDLPKLVKLTSNQVIYGYSLCLALVFMVAAGGAIAREADEKLLPEMEEVESLLQGPKPAGLVFHIYEQDEEALEWVLPRVEGHVRLIRSQWPGFAIVVVSHGAEMLALSKATENQYPRTHEMANRLANSMDVPIQICGAYAANVGLDGSDFPSYVDVVPSGPSQIADYLELGFNKIDLELIW